MNYEETLERLNKCGQAHILKYYDELSKDEQESLLEQIELTDFSVIDEGIALSQKGIERGKITPINVLTVEKIEKAREKYIKIGEEAIKKGEVAAVLLAGGAGSRLGFDGPKGKFDIGESRQVYIFQRLVENLIDVVTPLDTYIHLFIMTSEKNNKETVDFFAEKNYFGYPKEYIHFFIQEMAAATDYEGKVYLEEKGKIATSPNGNGGWYRSMRRTGMTDIVKACGIKWLNTFAVDNVLQKICDPAFVGATIESNSACGSKVIRKNCPEEKVGVLCLEDGKPSIVEYYDLTDEMKNTFDEKGNLVYNYGVILNYLLNVEKLEEIASKSLPLHVVNKKVPHLLPDGSLSHSETEDGYKYETLILDMIQMLGSCLGYEVVREKEFAPVKNMTGVDSVESARKLLKLNGYEI